jgi:hypothetical protein
VAIQATVRFPDRFPEHVEILARSRRFDALREERTGRNDEGREELDESNHLAVMDEDALWTAR